MTVFDLRRGEGRVIPIAGGPTPKCFTPDGALLLVTQLDEAALELRDPRTGRVMRTSGPLPYSLNGVDLLPGGTILVRLGTQQPNEERLYDFLRGRDVCNVAPHALVGHGAVFAASPDGRVLAVGTREVRLHDLATGREVGRLPAGHHGPVTALAFSQDRRLFATGGADGNVVLWDWKRACGLVGEPRPLDRGRLEELWLQLGDEDARAAYRAGGALSANPGAALPFLGGKLRAVAESDCRPVRRLIDDLDSDDFAVRQRATDQLQKLPGEWEFLLRQELDAKPSLEVLRRLEAILSRKQPADFSADMRRRLNAVWALEEMGSKEARDVIERLSHGVAGSPLTREAAEALHRWPR